MASHPSADAARDCPICREDDHRAGAHAVYLDPRCSRCVDLVAARKAAGLTAPEDWA